MRTRAASLGFFIAAAIIAAGWPCSAWSQSPLPVSARLEQGRIRIVSELDKAVILVGDHIQWSLLIKAPAGSEIRILPPGHELGPFFILDYQLPGQVREDAEKGRWPRIKNRIAELLDRERPEPGVVREQYRFTITSYLTGELSIPPLLITVIDREGKVHALFTQPTPVRVSPVTSPDDLMIRDIAGPVELPVPVAGYWRHLAALAGVLALAGLALLLLLRRRRKPRPELIPLRPAHELAFEELAALAGEGLLEAGEFERYYTRLSHILRKYLALRYLIYALEWTTSEIAERLAGEPIDYADYDESRRFLEEADRVKFGRHLPSLEERSTALARVRAIVERTRELPPAEAGERREAA